MDMVEIITSSILRTERRELMREDEQKLMLMSESIGDSSSFDYNFFQSN